MEHKSVTGLSYSMWIHMEKELEYLKSFEARKFDMSARFHIKVL